MQKKKKKKKKKKRINMKFLHYLNISNPLNYYLAVFVLRVIFKSQWPCN